MSELDLSFYQFYRQGNKIIAVSTYEGKTVRGYAKCDPKDVDNEWYGKVLAAARCNEKVARKRHLRARKCHKEACRNLEAALNLLNKRNEYVMSSEISERLLRTTIISLYSSNKVPS